MSRRKKIINYCRICGTYGKMSFEHVPPEAAFNKGKHYYKAEMDNVLKLCKDEFDFFNIKTNREVKKLQGGVGFFTLCNSCNNNTGSWYANSFVDWVYQCMGLLLQSNNKPTLYYPTYIYPLRILKQIIVMFFSIKHDYLRSSHEYLVRFILNKDEKYLPKDIKVYVYYNIEGANRYIGDTVIGSLSDDKTYFLSEITFPPLGFVMTLDGKCPDKRLTDISYFANYGYTEWIDHFQRFHTLPTHLPHIPGDYRTKHEILDGIREAKEFKQKNKF